MNIVTYFLALLLLALNVVDWRLTRACLLSGRGREGNVFMAYLIDRLGFGAASAIKLAAIVGLCLVLVLSDGRLASVLTLLGLDAFYIWVVRNNWRILHS